jgi:putative DNA primase/helicase
LPTQDRLQAWFSRSPSPGVAVIAGKVSGNLEILDFDVDALVIFPEWCALVEQECAGLIARLSVIKTPRPGFGVSYRCPDVVIPGNQKLALKPGIDPKKPIVLIETRGEGGYHLMPGCPIECHENRVAYEHYSGPRASQMPSISPKEREVLIRCAQAFNEIVPEEKPAPLTGSLRAGDDFNKRGWSWSEILTGWTLIRQSGAKCYWRRPGKEDPGWSATTGVCVSQANGWELFCNFSSNAHPFEAGQNRKNCSSYNKFTAYALLHHGGDFKAAARELGRLGFGDKPKPSANGNARRTKTEAGDKQSHEPGELNEVQVVEALDDPHRLARKYLWGDDRTREGKSALRFWRDEWHRWNGSCYRIVPDAEIKAEITDVIKGEFDRANVWAIKEWEANNHCDLQTGKLIPKPIAKKVTKHLLTNVAQVLQALTILPGTVESPSWLSEPAPFPASEILATKNSLIHLPSYVRGADSFSVKPTIDFFSPLCLDYEFDETAGQPHAWLDFLTSIWPHDQQSIDVLQEWFGYCLLPDTRQDKILVIIGPTRSGKGTIARMLAKIVGEANTCSPTLSSLGGPFGLQPLLGKTLAIITDARLSGRSDSAVILENLLSISGRDTRSVHRKNLTAIECKLPVRFMLMSNELPKLHDPSGALLGRLIMLQQTESWLNREDRELEPKLHAEEVQAILLWAIEGYRRLHQRGHFIQPASAIRMVERMEDLTNPVGAFIRDRCKLGPACEEYAQDLFNAWKSWCEANGQTRAGTVQTFGKDLLAAVPRLTDARPRDSLGKQAQKYFGIRLRTHEDDLMESKD